VKLQLFSPSPPFDFMAGTETTFPFTIKFQTVDDRMIQNFRIASSRKNPELYRLFDDLISAAGAGSNL